MNILIIASLYAPYARGGAEIITEQIARELAVSHNVTILTTQPWKGFSSLVPMRETLDGIAVYRFFPLNFFSFAHINSKPFWLRVLWSCLDFFNIHALFQVWRVISEMKPDVVMTHNIKGITYGIPWLLHKMNIRHMHVPHDIQLVYPNGLLLVGQEERLNSLVVRAYSALNRALFGSPRWIVCASHFLQNFYVMRGFFPQSKISVIPNPCSSLPLSVVSHKRDDGKIHFLFMGNLNESKGIQLLVEAFVKISNPEIVLHCVGTGSLEDKLRKAVAGDTCIEFLGYISGAEKFSLIARMDYVVVPSLCYENSPTVVYEAFSCGIPVIVANIGGAAEQVRDGKNGYVFECGKPDALEKTLQRACRHHAQWAKLSQAAKNSIQDKSVEHYCEKIIDVIAM